MKPFAAIFKSTKHFNDQVQKGVHHCAVVLFCEGSDLPAVGRGTAVSAATANQFSASGVPCAVGKADELSAFEYEQKAVQFVLCSGKATASLKKKLRGFPGCRLHEISENPFRLFTDGSVESWSGGEWVPVPAVSTSAPKPKKAAVKPPAPKVEEPKQEE
tara:strand:+ start:1872 stop:2351 length:480 start_codon:yes stop_codon:yes gene_type:complete